tara:strand:+ start:7087 stop:7608 length:522 start_codon:yes stop_codon:yes gene_type:complete
MNNTPPLTQKKLPESLLKAIEQAYTPAGYEMTVLPTREAESEEYYAYRFALNGKNIAYREAKTTPKKVGQFVTCWTRPIPNGPIVPFDTDDAIDYLIVSVTDKQRLGQFVFDKDTLIKKGIMCQHGKKGKLAFRVYGPWVTPTVLSAIRAQKWQLEHYIDIDTNSTFKLFRDF